MVKVDIWTQLGRKCAQPGGWNGRGMVMKSEFMAEFWGKEDTLWNV